MNESLLHLLTEAEASQAFDMEGVEVWRNGEPIEHLEGASGEEIVFALLNASRKDTFELRLTLKKSSARG